MKENFFKVCIVLFISSCIGDVLAEDCNSWLDNFILAEEFNNQGNLESAVNQLDLAIDLAKDQIFLFVKRGKALEKMKKYDEAFRDFNYVINQEFVDIQELVPALWGRARLFLRNGKIDNALQDYEKVKVLDPDFPKIESNKHVLVWRNINPLYLTESFKEEFTNSMIQTGICQCSEDVSFNERGVCIIKKQSNCDSLELRQKQKSERGCDCFKNKKTLSLDEIFLKNNNPTDETDCNYWCDRVYSTSMVMCSGFETLKCKTICAGVVETCKHTCYRCCAGEGFYKNCVKPFEDFMERVGCEDNIW